MELLALAAAALQLHVGLIVPHFLTQPLPSGFQPLMELLNYKK
jgi:hypothetical protein